MTGFHGGHVTFGVIWLVIFAVSRLADTFKQKMLIIGSVFSVIIAMAGTMMTHTLDVIPGVATPIAYSVFGIGLLGTIGTLYMLKTSDNQNIESIQKEEGNLELAGLYWHFVDIVWIVIFTVVYLISANDGAPLL